MEGRELCAVISRAAQYSPFSVRWRKIGILPVREDSASSLSAHETTGWKPVFHDRQDAYPPAKLTGSDRPSFFDELSVGNE